MVSEQNAKNVITAFTACDNSHRQRSCSQSAGTWVQLLVAWLAGKVKAKKITSVATRQSPADQREDRGRALCAYEQRKRNVRNCSSNQNDPEQRPAAIDALGNKVVAFAQVDLVRQGEQGARRRELMPVRSAP